MSYAVKLSEVETLHELKEWLKGNLPNGLIVETEGEIIIHTGLTVEMNGEIIPLDLEELGEIRA